jgi:hypothetical protein
VLTKVALAVKRVRSFFIMLMTIPFGLSSPVLAIR